MVQAAPEAAFFLKIHYIYTFQSKQVYEVKRIDSDYFEE